MDRPFVIRKPRHVDDRGTVWCPYELGDTDRVPSIVRTYVVHNWESGRIRAWHGHRKAWTGMHVIHGVAKFVAMAMEPEDTDDTPWALHQSRNPPESVVSSDINPCVFWIPPGWYNGSITLASETKVLVYSTLSFEDVKHDDYRKELTHNDVVQFFRVVTR